MHPRTSPSVFKYFDVADRFVRIRIAGPREAGLRARPGLDRAGYRRAVIAACVEGYEEPAEKLAELYPADPEGALELLYQMVVAVNPSLEIRGVGLVEDAPARVAAALATPAPALDPAPVRRALRRRVRSLPQRLGRRVFGQSAAIERVAGAARRAAAGLERERGPLASLLFVGPTGTGKTELARELSRALLGEDSLLRIDCGELGLAHETARLVGAPPGFVGFEDGGLLTEGMRVKPRAVVLFDEVEKAHPRLHHVLLSVLEEGELLDGKGRAVSFRDAFVVLTSNAGARESTAAGERVGFAPAPLEGGARSEIAARALRATFSPELLGRIDEIVHFNALGPRELSSVAARQLGDLARRVRARGLRMRWTRAVAAWAAATAAADAAGVRAISALLRREVEEPLALAMLELLERSSGERSSSAEGALGDRPWLCVGMRAGRPRVTISAG